MINKCCILFKKKSKKPLPQSVIDNMDSVERLNKIVDKSIQSLDSLKDDEVNKVLFSLWRLFAYSRDLTDEETQKLFDKLTNLHYRPTYPEDKLSIVEFIVNANLKYNDKLINQFNLLLCKHCLRYELSDPELSTEFELASTFLDLKNAIAELLNAAAPKLEGAIVKSALNADVELFDTITDILLEVAKIYSYTAYDDFVSIFDKLSNKFTDEQVELVKNVFLYAATALHLNVIPTKLLLTPRLGPRLGNMGVSINEAIGNAHNDFPNIDHLSTAILSSIESIRHISGLYALAIIRICKLLNGGGILTTANWEKIEKIIKHDPEHLENVVFLLGENLEITQEKFDELFDQTKLFNDMYESSASLNIPSEICKLIISNTTYDGNFHDKKSKANDSKFEPVVADKSSLTSPLLSH